MVGRHLGLIVIIDFFLFPICTEETRHTLCAKELFRDSPLYLSREHTEENIDYHGAQETVRCGGNWPVPGNMSNEYGVSHNWHMNSIF